MMQNIFGDLIGAFVMLFYVLYELLIGHWPW